MNGLFSAVYGISSVLGPLAGAYFTDNINWRWIFYINVPIGILAVLLLVSFYKESGTRHKQVIDWTGAVLLAVTILSLMFALELGGREFAWDSWQILCLFVLFVAGLLVFLRVETKAVNPIISLKLFKNKVFTASQLSSFLYGAILISGSTYIPIFVTGVYGGSASAAGQTLMPMMLGVVASSIFGGRFIGKFTFRNIMMVSAAVLILSLSLLGSIDAQTDRWVVTLYMIFVGLGIGVSFVVFNISTLHGVNPQSRGVATSMIVFFRTIGSALSVTIFGVIQTALLHPSVRSLFPDDVLQKMIGGLADSIAYVFQWSVALAVLALILILLMGKANIEKTDVELPVQSFD